MKKSKKVLIGLVIASVIGLFGFSRDLLSGSSQIRVYASESTEAVDIQLGKKSSDISLFFLDNTEEKKTEQIDEPKEIDVPEGNEDVKEEPQEIVEEVIEVAEEDVAEKVIVEETVEVTVEKQVEVNEPVKVKATDLLDKSVLTKNGDTYTYSDFGEVVVIVETDGVDVISISFYGLSYYGYKYVSEQLLINENGEEEGKRMYQENQQQVKNIESAIRAGVEAADAGDSVYQEILSGGESQNVYTKNF